MLGAARRPSATTEQLARATGAAERELVRALGELEERGDVVRVRRKRWALAERSGLLTGKVKVDRSGRALVILDVAAAPLAVERGELRPAMDGDHVLVEETPYARGGLRRAKIRRVLERGRTRVVGVASAKAPRRLLPMDPRLAPYLVLLHDRSDPAPPGEVVAAEIVEYPSMHRDILVRVTEVLGEAGRLATEIRGACIVRGIEEAFDEQALAEAEACGEPTAADLEGRRDLRDELTLTVDPADAKDHDDAVSIAETNDGWRLTVSIADVSHYVRRGSALDAAAYERATSVYFPGTSVPMLPERLSADLASLHPGVDRLTVSVFLDIDARGRVHCASFRRSVIHSVASLTYEEVQAVLDADARAAPETPAMAAGIRDALLAMAACARALHQRRMQRGAIDMDLPESVVVLDESGDVETIRRRPRLFAHRLIEEFMLAANEAVAERIDRAGGAFLYRIHEAPDDDAVDQLAKRTRALGLRLERDGAITTPSMFQRLLAAAEGRPEARQVSSMVLRTMTQARYSAAKEIHFGLASRCYTHFTSPIRRYPDIVAHRALLEVEAADPRPGARGEWEQARLALAPAADHTSARERRAMAAERDVAQAAACLYVQRHLGRVLEGTVSGVDRFGYWVELDVAFVEGFVHVGRLREYFDFVAERMELQSRVSAAVVHIGMRTRIRVAAVDLGARRIDFDPA